MIDLASLKKPAAGAAGAGASRPSAHEVAVTEQGLEQLVADSQRTPTLILVTSPRVAEGEQFLGSLRRAVDAQGGAVRLATVDADAQQRVAAALKVEQLPTLLLLLLGQVQPIVQSALPDEEVDNLVQQVLEVAGHQGMEPAGPTERGGPQEGPARPPPQMAKATEAIAKAALAAAGAPSTRNLTQTPAAAA